VITLSQIPVDVIAVDLFAGRRLLLDDTRYRFHRFEQGGEKVVLVAEDGTSRLASLSRAELYTRLCVGTARLESPFAVWGPQ